MLNFISLYISFEDLSIQVKETNDFKDIMKSGYQFSYGVYLFPLNKQRLPNNLFRSKLANNNVDKMHVEKESYYDDDDGMERRNRYPKSM